MTKPRAPRNRTALLFSAVVSVAALGLAGCSADSNGGDSPDGADPEETSTTISGELGDLEDPEGAISALSGFTCEPGKDGSWSAEATLTNSASSTMRFLVLVSVIKSKTHEVLGDVEKTYALKAGADKQIVMDEIYDKDKDGLECVPRVVSGK